MLFLTQGGLHAYTNNINCAIQCLKNPLNQSVSNMLEQKISLEEALGKCTQDLKDSHATEVEKLAKIKHEKDLAVREINQLIEDCKQNYTNITQKKDKILKEKNKLEGNLISCQQNSTELKNLLADATDKSKKLATYVEHLQLLEVIDNHTRELHTCRVWLKEYCALKRKHKSSSLDEYENNTMNTFAKWLGCDDPLPDANHYEKILPSFTRRVKSVLEIRDKLEQMLIRGDFKAMRGAQEGVKDLPSEKCNFLCTYTQDQEDEESKDPSSSFSVKALEAGWNLFSRVWWLRGDN